LRRLRRRGILRRIPITLPVSKPYPREIAKGWQEEGDEHTKSAKLSNSCPIKLLFFLHLATFPSIKSKNNPKGIKANAAYKFPYASSGPSRYRIELKMDITPQKPIMVSSPSNVSRHGGKNKPFNSVIKSAKCNILIIEK